LIEAGHAKIISVDPITNRKIARAVESDNPVEIKGWVRSEEHDAQLADGSMNHVDQALFKMNIHQVCFSNHPLFPFFPFCSQSSLDNLSNPIFTIFLPSPAPPFL
jgi:hypothetical protein